VVRLAAVGDIMLARSVGERLERDGPVSILAGVAATLRAADIAVANLECAISERGQAANKGYTFRAAPPAATALAAGGIDVVSLANNHSLDFGPVALLDSIAHLQRNGVKSVGAGASAAVVRQPAIVAANGLRVAFLAYVDVPSDGSFSRAAWEAGEATPGVAWLDPGNLAADIREAHRAADIVVVLLHFGREFADHPTADQRAQARAAIDAGASLVLGSHSHVLQEVEAYGGGLIAYSLGNFVFDGFDPPSNDSAILEVDLTRDGPVAYRLVPVSVVDGLPQLAAP
jgi:poly-gamma-glutamate synthesis protein (capsule biosynthesis protein)